jgi:hypothetical protein
MNQTQTTSDNGNNHQATGVDVLADDQQSTGAFYDPSNPLFAPPREIDKTKQKAGKRRLITLCFVFVLLSGGGLALYQLLKVNRVNVKVQADPRQDAQNPNTKGDSKSSENSLSTEAVNITRTALGSDTATSGNSSTPSTTPTLAQPGFPESVPLVLPSLSGTVTPLSANDNGSTNPRTPPASSAGAKSDRQDAGTNSATQNPAPSRANLTHSIFVEDATPRVGAMTIAVKSKPEASITPAVLPPFGTMLPVRTQGVVFTLRNNSYARLELVRDMKGTGWSLPKGTVLIGRASGSEYDRAFINVIGYLDQNNRLVKMSGEVLGSDGGSGIQGKRVVVESGSLKRALTKIASSGMQAAGMLANGFGGQRTVVVDGTGSRIINPLTDEASRLVGGASADKRAFVKVEAGRPAYVMVADLPKDRPTIDAPGEDELQHGASLTDRELMELLLLGTREEISAAIPLMTDEQRTLALKTLASGNEKK